jgi:hypothetical protein
VRCGICSSSFNAIEFLNEQPIPRQSDKPAFEDTITVEEVHGTEFIELSGTAPGTGAEDREEEADSTLETDDADLDQAQDADLEFHGSAQDLERLFVTVEPRPSWPPSAEDRAASAAAALDDDVDLEQAIRRIAEGEFSGMEVLEERFPEGLDHGDTHPGQIAAVLAFPPGDARQAESVDQEPAGTTETVPEDGPQVPEASGDEDADTSDLDRTDEYPLLVLEGPGEEYATSTEDDEPDVSPQAAAVAAVAADEIAEDQPPATESDAAPGEEPEIDAADEAIAGDQPPRATADAPAEAAASEGETLLLLIPEELRRDHTASPASAFEPTAESGAGPRRWPWFLAAGVLLLLLATQAVHFWRDDLSRNPAVGPWLMRAYAALGIPLTPPADLSAFELRQLGAASDGLQAGRIKLRASIVNRADFAQPLPLLRLSLQDRFGSTIGTRDLEPAEYLPGGAAPASGLLGPAQRADAEVVFVDPGRDAVGFELDVCLREAGTIRCSAVGEASK